MFPSTYLVVCSVALALCLPSAGSCAREGDGGKQEGEGAPPSSPWLPQIKGGPNLPAPAPASKLLRVGLGFGLQNYTCESGGGAPVPAGALAVLYDVTGLAVRSLGRRDGKDDGHAPKQRLSPREMHQLPARVLWSHLVPLRLNYSGGAGRVDASSPGASATDPFSETQAGEALSVWGLDEPLEVLGRHLFGGVPSAAGEVVPEFELRLDGDGDGDGRAAGHPSTRVLCRKLAAVGAPPDADRGPRGTGAVPWLELGAWEEEEEHPGRAAAGGAPVRYVYRVSTAGGAPRACAGAVGADSTPYAALYWFWA